MKIDNTQYPDKLIRCIEQSEGVYSNDVEKLVVSSTIDMLFYKFSLMDYLDDYNITKSDYKQWFERPAFELGLNDLLQDFLFCAEDKDGK